MKNFAGNDCIVAASVDQIAAPIGTMYCSTKARP